MQDHIDNDVEQTVNVIYNKFICKPTIPGKFRCPFDHCNKTYSTAESLKRHLIRHSTNKKHVCKYCQKAFLRKSECEIHQRIHTGEKPYVCEICSKSFARATDLKIHLKYHSADKPFKCPFEGCNLAFKRKK
ncbi:hypothetical protein QTN25_006199 [Entamoeba marina]